MESIRDGILSLLDTPPNYVRTNSPLDYFSSTRIGSLMMMGTKYFMRIFGAIMICVAMVLMSGVGFMYFYAIIPLMVGQGNVVSFWGLILFGAGIYCGVNTYFNYITCVMTDPGGTPDEWVESVPQMVADAWKRNESKTIPGRMWSKFCNKCRKPKPPRAHHCHICDTCVLRQDHHCPWLNRCVGLRNHKYFILFLTHLWLCCFLLSAFLGGINMDILYADPDIWYDYHSTFSFILVLTGSMTVTLGAFTAWHYYLVATNQTTIEFQFNKLKYFTQDEDEYSIADYNMGLIKNVKSIFGPGPFWTYFFPSYVKPTSDGVHYEAVEITSRSF